MIDGRIRQILSNQNNFDSKNIENTANSFIKNNSKLIREIDHNTGNKRFNHRNNKRFNHRKFRS